MRTEAKDALAVVDGLLNELVAAATNQQVRAKLGNLNAACRMRVVDAGQRLTVPALIKLYKTHFTAPEQSIAESSLRNKRDGANPYAVLYAAWEGAASFVLAPGRGSRRQPAPGEMLSTEDVAGIADIALRHQVGLVLAQNRSMKSQLDILKRAEGAPIVRLVGPGYVGEVVPKANHLALTETEIEALRNFLKPGQLRARGLLPCADGAIETRDRRRLTDPGFQQALEKIVKSYDPSGG